MKTKSGYLYSYVKFNFWNKLVFLHFSGIQSPIFSHMKMPKLSNFGTLDTPKQKCTALFHANIAPKLWYIYVYRHLFCTFITFEIHRPLLGSPLPVCDLWNANSWEYTFSEKFDLSANSKNSNNIKYRAKVKLRISSKLNSCSIKWNWIWRNDKSKWNILNLNDIKPAVKLEFNLVNIDIYPDDAPIPKTNHFKRMCLNFHTQNHLKSGCL